MFGNLGNITNLLKQASQMKANMARMQETLSQQTVVGEAGAGMVRATVNGKLELVNIEIDPQALEDVAVLEELVRGAVAAAQRKAQEHVKAEVAKLTGGVDIPGLDEMFNTGDTAR